MWFGFNCLHLCKILKIYYKRKDFKIIKHSNKILISYSEINLLSRAPKNTFFIFAPKHNWSQLFLHQKRICQLGLTFFIFAPKHNWSQLFLHQKHICQIKNPSKKVNFISLFDFFWKCLFLGKMVEFLVIVFFSNSIWLLRKCDKKEQNLFVSFYERRKSFLPSDIKLNRNTNKSLFVCIILLLWIIFRQTSALFILGLNHLTFIFFNYFYWR